MKVRFTHKELTLLAGIVVAIIIMIAFWLQPASAESTEVSRKKIPSVTKPATKAVVEKAFFVIRHSLE